MALCDADLNQHELHTGSLPLHEAGSRGGVARRFLDSVLLQETPTRKGKPLLDKAVGTLNNFYGCIAAIF